MAEHRIVIERQGRSFAAWEPGEAGEIHERVGFHCDAFPDEWELVRAKCSCGVEFDDDADVWAHLDEVAAEPAETGAEAAMVEASGERRDETGAADVSVPEYPVLVDVFRVNAWLTRERSDRDHPVSGWTGLDTPLAEEAWTARKLLTIVRRELPWSIWSYDTVCYRAEPADEDAEFDVVAPETEMVRVPRSAVVAEVVPRGRPVRVTNRELAPYVFVDPPE